jgi:hypothetical protein
MAIEWRTVATAVVTAVLVTLVVEYLVKPGLEARKEGHLTTARNRRALLVAILDLAMAAQIVSAELPGEAAWALQRAFREERERHYGRLRTLAMEMFDNLGRYAQAYPWPYRDEPVAFVMCLYGVMISTRPKRRQAEIILGLAQVAARVFDPSIRRPSEWQLARAQLAKLISETEMPADLTATASGVPATGAG